MKAGRRFLTPGNCAKGVSQQAESGGRLAEAGDSQSRMRWENMNSQSQETARISGGVWPSITACKPLRYTVYEECDGWVICRRLASGLSCYFVPSLPHRWCHDACETQVFGSRVLSFSQRLDT